jgi:hypothetical protein
VSFFTFRFLAISVEIDEGLKQKGDTSDQQHDEKSDQRRPTGCGSALRKLH